MTPLVVSEVGNLSIMRLGNLQTLNEIADLFGLDGKMHGVLRKTLHFPKGRALLLGEWAKKEPIFLMTAMRRMVDSSLHLDPDYWASPLE